MLPSLGPFPVHQKMQLEAVSEAYLSRDKSTLEVVFRHTLSQPQIPQGHGKVGVGSRCNILAKINQPIWIFQLEPLVLFSVGVQEA